MMKSSIEYRNIASVGERAPHRLDSRHTRRIMERRERDQIAEVIEHLIIDNHWFNKTRPTMHNSVPDHVNHHWAFAV
jgi:hypothetical protein